ncbi:hypothetical protein BX616_000677 [Lobosporangium transversale]|nr:hypothetical protein BX616_000677 [Lobosporangium transversale]
MFDPVEYFPPEVIEVIASYLLTTELAACSRVCWQWRQAFKHSLWSEFKEPRQEQENEQSTGLIQPNTSYLQYLRNTILENEHRFQVLSLQSFELATLLTREGSKCVHLKRLHCRTFNAPVCEYDSGDASVPIDGSGDSDNISEELHKYATLIAQNPNLQSFSFQSLSTARSYFFYKRLLSTLNNHCLNIRFLTLTSIQIPLSTVQMLFWSLPKRLEALDFRANAIFWSSYSQNGGQEYPYEQLRRLVISIRGHRYTNNVFSGLLRRCPNLQECCVLELFDYDMRFLFMDLSRYCVGLQSLEITQQADVLHPMLRHIDPLSTKLKTFHLGGDFTCRTFFVATILDLWCNTLQDLEFGQDVRFHAPGLLNILTRCPSLRRLVHRIPYVDPPTQARDYINRGGLLLSDFRTKFWVCLGLQELEIYITDNRHFERVWTNQTPLELVYEQLGALKDLRKLRLGWLSMKDSELYNSRIRGPLRLDFSLEGGLELLRDLKQLEELDIFRIHKIFVRQAEVEWMNEHWPRIRRIRGLLEQKRDALMAEEQDQYDEWDEVYRVPFVDRNKAWARRPEEEFEHISWLRKQRPWVEIC